jgi:ATP-dependent RNA helicase DeaD
MGVSPDFRHPPKDLMPTPSSNPETGADSRDTAGPDPERAAQPHPDELPDPADLGPAQGPDQELDPLAVIDPAAWPVPEPDADAAPDPERAPAPAPEPAPTAATDLVAEAEPVAATEPDSGFSGLGLDAGMLQTLSTLGYEEPTPVQREAIPPILAGRDVLAEAPTGTGKTAAFALPVLQRLFTDDGARGRRGAVRALVLVPTRELAMQVSEALHGYGASLRVRVLAVYGGQPIGQQLRALERGVDVVVATPGRAVDHLTRGSLSLDGVSVVILDEADEMLDMGFAEDLETILGAVPAGHQTALFSATIPPAIVGIARRHLQDPVRLRVRSARSESGATISTIRQVAYVVRRSDKLAALCRVLDVEDPTSALVFGRTRGEVDELAERLGNRGHDAAALHGGMSQDQRDRVMNRFREGSLDVLVATDVAARGLDIQGVSHVVNYDVPTDTDAYVHRIGRTGRAGREGVAITLLEPREHRLLREIERVTGSHLELGKVPTVADLRERRMELLRASLREALLQNGTDRFRAVVEPLAEEFDIVDIALAAISLAAGPGSEPQDETEIATLPLFEKPTPRDRKPTGAALRGPDGARPPRPRDPDWERSGPGQANWVRLYIGGGRRAGLRPGDLVGAITNEAGVPGAAIGAIEINDAFSLVDVRADAAELVVGALQDAPIRGKRLEVRREGGPGPAQGPRPAPHWTGAPRSGPGGPPRPGPGGPRPPTRGPGPWSHSGPRPQPKRRAAG